jgi:hypothetical protein
VTSMWHVAMSKYELVACATTDINKMRFLLDFAITQAPGSGSLDDLDNSFLANIAIWKMRESQWKPYQKSALVPCPKMKNIASEPASNPFNNLRGAGLRGRWPNFSRNCRRSLFTNHNRIELWCWLIETKCTGKNETDKRTESCHRRTHDAHVDFNG